MLQAIKYSQGHLEILDQLQLPFVEKYIPIRSAEDGWHAIKDMKVRGAPAIAIVAMLALASELQSLGVDGKTPEAAEETRAYIVKQLEYLLTSRPTAVNLSDAARKLGSVVETRANQPGANGHDIVKVFIQAAEEMMVKDLDDNQKIGHNGAEWIMANAARPGASSVAVLTHCNTGSLATSGYGTALGVVRSLASKSTLRHAYCTETRPYNQGSRLTAFEMVHDKIPATLITDSMAAALLADPSAGVSAIVVGADRVAANGDTANKIGTYGLAVLAKHHGVKFLVAAPLTTIDLATKSGNDIIIEQRAASEVTSIKGPREGADTVGGVVFDTVRIAAPGINVWNPAFDITPSALIDGVITEVGVVEKGPDGQFDMDGLFKVSAPPV
ncbi:Methylthioribose-1-phosphate isomerase [Penicillium atrosanguineum]|uniref:Methylthioribose-1-phosphate isomerase n=1 Tax=Penicillium atrosanguineum TaxID=1132637 RepID=A0A9W9PZL5_9EURO|nr:Methylthioribose-1-phosphate isomerase [Penicillium atrosanguineum]KAJ5142074.1 Methylthioribose-1-phosphate isomerase [Penicillium atrosanguineum]KAJ5321064.1 Methylthioribose-1-phosphate isomerase [Penicillium atrosanguineum]